MIQIQTNPDLQCLLWIFSTEMQFLGIGIRIHYKNKIFSIEIQNDNVLNTHRSVERSLCHVLSYCYQQKFSKNNNVISSTPQTYTRPTLNRNDSVIRIYNEWHQKKNMPSLNI